MSVVDVQNVFKIVVFLNLFSDHVLSISELDFRCLGLQNRRLRIESYCKNLFFMEIAFSEFRDAFLSFFGNLGSRFPDFLSLENKLKHQTFFGVKTNLESGIWLGRSVGIGPSKDIKA